MQDCTTLLCSDGVEIIAATSTLTKSSYFKAVLSSTWNTKDKRVIFVDRESSIMRLIIDLLRYGDTRVLPELLDSEYVKVRSDLDYFGISITMPQRNSTSWNEVISELEECPKHPSCDSELKDSYGRHRVRNVVFCSKCSVFLPSLRSCSQKSHSDSHYNYLVCDYHCKKLNLQILNK
eukprot:TRINITY_DN6307_c0_g1_i1.p1 TRINITY_DN6307_c0_g1~~TRINITY_DN6307_c0_g1_i1.p1  ORF type:complete len:178 (+),score=1.32 TRINITY_DN6307_c0_g1_i1:67-600(+)